MNKSFNQWHPRDADVRLHMAITAASVAHCGQQTKEKTPYISHPIYVMSKCSGLSQKMVAVLHDVLEDTDINPSYLRTFLSTEEAAALDAITKRKGEPYDAYIARVTENPIARAVKIQDLKHNLMDRGWTLPPEKFEKYQQSLTLLMNE